MIPTAISTMPNASLQVMLLLRLQNSFYAFRKLMAPMPGSASVISALDSVCSSLRLLTDFHILSRAAHDRLKNRNRVLEDITLSDTLHALSLPSIYPFYFEFLRLPGSALPIPILVSHEAVVSVGNSETVFFSEHVRVEDQALVLKPVLISPFATVASTSDRMDTCTVIAADVKHSHSPDSKMVINWGSVTPENDPLSKSQKFNHWFIGVQCARVALWNFENRPECLSGPTSGNARGLRQVACAYRWFPHEALQQIMSIAGLCTHAIESISENAADVLRARGLNM